MVKLKHKYWMISYELLTRDQMLRFNDEVITN